jgi:CRP-like cAMP-binding protein
MEFVSRILDGSIAYDLKYLLRRGEPARASIGQDEKARHLQKVPMLAECSQRQLRRVAAIARVVEAPAGSVLTRTGEPGEEFFLILDGAATVDVPGRRRSRLGPSDFFGEMSLLDGEPRSATVTADTDVRLLVIVRRNFQALLREVPELTQTILAVLSRRLRRAEQTRKV